MKQTIYLVSELGIKTTHIYYLYRGQNGLVGV
ncbi:uncharacterized protein METZ01_LOCUS271697 [marine metagenome]|uniref:Uncharacterized protein n=1 Tax=marine metagenome TaxID=408172 RepID=A0A382K5Q7_9ZZZZ